jgi:hypothetical protein
VAHFPNEKAWFTWAFNDLDYKPPEQVRERIHQLAAIYDKQPWAFKAPETVTQLLMEHYQKRQRHAMKVAVKDARWKTASSDVPEQLRKALDAISYMPNAVANWMEAHGGNHALASVNSKKVRQAENLLGEVLASLPAAIEYDVSGIAGQRLRFKSREDLIRGLARMGIKHVGESEDSTQFKPETRGQPKFDQLVGPMYGGPGVARYETSEVNDAMSR